MLSESSINEFVEYYSRSHVIIETTVKAVLKKTMEWETIFDKPFYSFKKEEILKMYSELRAISSRSLQNDNLILQNAAKYFLYHKRKKIVEEYESITKEDLEKCTIKRELISRTDLDEIQAQLPNATDCGILELLFLGANGDWMRELTFFEFGQVSRKDWKIYFKTKTIPIDHKSYEIIQAACNEKELISYTAEAKVTSVQGNGVYKKRFNTIRKNNNIKDEADLERRYRYIQRRLAEINKYLGINLTPKLLNMSGLWYHIQKSMKRMEISNFKEFLFTKEAEDLALRYGFSKRYYVQILLDKYKDYI